MSSNQQVTVSRSRKAAKKAAKKEYYFSPELWRLIMAYVGTPDQYIARYYSLYINDTRPLVRRLPELPTYLGIIGIPITKKQYDENGFKLQHKDGLLYDIQPELPKDMVDFVKRMISYTLPGFDRSRRRIIKVLVKQANHPTYANNVLNGSESIMHRLVRGGDFIVVFSSVNCIDYINDDKKLDLAMKKIMKKYYEEHPMDDPANPLGLEYSDLQPRRIEEYTDDELREIFG